MTEMLWVRLPPGAELFYLIFLSLNLSLSISGVSLIRSIAEVQHY